ncbi:hypothetical protein CONPUDRAFT_160594 [Coniophora puteana RWD-64-598 SS2]|uniref:Uncharacterized protein n=1 Tax=Coniophora puteana (strain RWD-64-598) TaxID=741705 RepID=R7SDR3_CONPW|nr:uncharacterized protein CONPUDRAFT_160594 [Coniophora puteana RWD-64-598 SS2]EIW73897.1 hypothetical protein CONPUDRAFT_160594 [Coniophora puteana RWD-64-598 SS2]
MPTIAIPESDLYDLMRTRLVPLAHMLKVMRLSLSDWNTVQSRMRPIVDAHLNRDIPFAQQPQDRLSLVLTEGLRVLPDMANYAELWPLSMYTELNIFDNIRHMHERRDKRKSRRSGRGLSLSSASHSSGADITLISVETSPSPVSTTSMTTSSQGANSSSGSAIDQKLAAFLRTDCGVPLTKTADALAALGISDMVTFNAAVRKENGEAFEEFIEKNGAQHGLTLWEIFSMVRGANKLRNSKE